jgi:Flp pilus assembly protein TadG
MLTLPIMLIMLGIVVNVANLWLARIELENALEAAALAAVKEWGDAGGGATDAPRDVGVAYAAANSVRCIPLRISTNLDPSPSADNPNANLACNPVRCDRNSARPPRGNLIFGAIADTDPNNPVTFNAGVAGGCIPATVFIDITKADSGSAVNARYFGIFYDEGPANLSIRSVSFTIPVLGKRLNQQPYFGYNAESAPLLVSKDHAAGDELNRFNTVFPNDVRGLVPDPVSGTDNWICSGGSNPNGDICFTLSNLVDTYSDRFRTITINFADGTFTSTNDPSTTEFVRFGASINQLNPPAAPPGTQNDGESFHLAPVRVTVVFYDSTSGSSRTASGVFVDDGDPDNGKAIATIGGGSGSGALAVRAQAIVSIQSIWSRLLALCSRPLCVSACATAAYDCSTGRVELIRVDRFICPGP